MKKKLCGAALAFAILIGLFNIPAWATEDARVLANGECGAVGNDVTWTLYRDGRFIVSGVGDMRDYSGAENLPWRDYRDQIKAVEIQDGVTSVGNNAFRTCSHLASVALPAGLKSIGNVAFSQCSALKEIKISGAETGGGENALPAAVTTIGVNAFGYCAFEKVSIPASVAQIGDGAFFKCAALTDINVAEGNARYSSQDGILFDKAATVLICYPAAKAAEEYAIPEGVTKIGDYAFHSAANLKKAAVPAGLTEIGQWAFAYNTVLSEIELPAELTAVGDYAFYGCTALSDDEGNAIEGAKVIFAGNRQQWSALEMGAGNYRFTNANVQFGDMKQDNIVASGECGALGSNASWSLNSDGDFVISGNGEMLNYASAASVPWAGYDAGESESEEEGEGEKAKTLKDLRPDIKTVTVEGSVTRNDAGEITARKGVSNVGDYAFYDCENLTAVTLPPTLTAIGAQAFSGCPLLADINLSETETASIGDYAFNGSAALTAVELPDTLKTIGKRAFLRSGLESVEIPASVEEIGEWAFDSCQSMAAFKMEELEEGADTHYSSIGDYAVADCAALTEVSLTENLTVIGEYAFSRCAALTGIAIPSSVSQIGACAFYGCSALASVSVDKENSSYCNTDNGMLLNKEQTCIFQYPSGNPNSACAIPQSVNSVAAFAFDGAANLKEVIYEITEDEWKESFEPNIGAHNAPLLAANPNYAEGHDPNNDTSIDAFSVDETEEGRVAVVGVHCGENAFGAQVWCATYEADGRFLGLEESPELSPGADDEISFALPEGAASLRLFVTDGEAIPLCPTETRDLSAAA